VPDGALFAADVLLPAILFSKMKRKNEVMPKNAFYWADPARMALEEMESYCATHPNSPSTARRPALSIRTGLGSRCLALALKKESLELASLWKEHFAPSTHNT
jgi:hypothetical protein